MGLLYLLLHIYLKFKIVKDCPHVRSCTDWVDGGTDVKPCKSECNWLKCISKEDEEPYFNVEVDKLLFNYKALYWARNTEKFQFTSSSSSSSSFGTTTLCGFSASQPSLFKYFCP
jgi:hypothetical protein